MMSMMMLHAHYTFDTTLRLFTKHLKRFYTKFKLKNDRKSIGAFEKHADDVTYGRLIFLEISEVVRK